VTFASVVTGHLVTIEIDVLPREIVALGDAVRAQILKQGTPYFPTQLGGLANLVSVSLLNTPTAFNPGIIQALANDVLRWINSGSSTLANLAGTVRASLIDVGFQMAGRGLRSATANATSPLTMQTSGGGASASQGAATPSLLRFQVDAARPLPVIGTGSYSLVSSRSGANSLVACQTDATHLAYTLSQGPSWSASQTLPLSSQMTADQALALLSGLLNH
jgi:hypothetical protein